MVLQDATQFQLEKLARSEQLTRKAHSLGGIQITPKQHSRQYRSETEESSICGKTEHKQTTLPSKRRD